MTISYMISSVLETMGIDAEGIAQRVGVPVEQVTFSFDFQAVLGECMDL
jgi:hypothetical protein